MPTITDFQEWLDNLDDKDIEDIYFLYTCIETKSDLGLFKCSEKDGKLFISNGDNDQVLLLASEKAEKTFCDKLNHDFGGAFGSVELEYDYVRMIRKDD